MQDLSKRRPSCGHLTVELVKTAGELAGHLFGALPTKQVVTVAIRIFDSASGAWPLTGDGEGQHVLAYSDSWGGWYNGVHYADNVELAKAKFPKARVVQISVVPPGQKAVAGYDVENGALTIEEACGLVNHDIVKLNRRPFLYGAGDTIPELKAYIHQHYTQIQDKVDYFLAQPDGVSEVPPGFIGKQFSWPDVHPIVANQGYDVSVLLTTAACLKTGDRQ